MPWRDAKSIKFSRIHVVANVPSSAGVFAIQDGAATLLVGESWNLKGRLLELANALTESEHLQVTFELCSEDDLARRKAELTRALEVVQEVQETQLRSLPGIILRGSQSRQNL